MLIGAVLLCGCGAPAHRVEAGAEPHSERTVARSEQRPVRPGPPPEPAPENALGVLRGNGAAPELGAAGADPAPQSTPPVIRPFDPESMAERGLAREVIQEVIRAQAPRMRHCYERRLATDPTAAGRVMMRFLVGPDGAVTSAVVQPDASTLDAPDLHRCMEAVMRSARFPEPVGGIVVLVNYPWAFTPSG